MPGREAKPSTWVPKHKETQPPEPPPPGCEISPDSSPWMFTRYSAALPPCSSSARSPSSSSSSASWSSDSISASLQGRHTLLRPTRGVQSPHSAEVLRDFVSEILRAPNKGRQGRGNQVGGEESEGRVRRRREVSERGEPRDSSLGVAPSLRLSFPSKTQKSLVETIAHLRSTQVLLVSCFCLPPCLASRL